MGENLVSISGYSRNLFVLTNSLVLFICPAGEKDSTPHTPTTIEQEEEALSPWLHVNGQTQEVAISVGSCGRSLCNGRAEHGLPLPATELGDSALVTAKTGQPVEV